MASRQHSFALIGQLRAAVRPACANSRRNFASTSIASADERSGSGSGPSSSPGQANRDPSSDSRPPRKSSPLEEAKPSTISEALDPVADLGGEPGTESAKTARPSMSISSKTRGRRGRKSASSEVPAIRFDDKALQSFPPLLERSHPVFDQHDRLTVPPTDRFKYGATYTEYNNEKKPYFPGGTADQTVLARTDEHSDAERESILNRVPLTKREMAGLHMHIIDRRYPQQQTGKGKIQSLSVLTVVGNGNGLVGMANEKHEEAELAHVRSLQQAIKNMEYIKRFEGRTIHRSLVGTFSATTVYLRPRPPGFGLRCPPTIHAVARSAGISDLSANIIGSTHPINVCRAVLSALSSGSGPSAFGNGIGGPGRRVDRGQGAKTLEDIEVERGRRFRILQG